MPRTVTLTDHIFPSMDIEREIIESADGELEFVDASTPEEVITSADDPTGIMTTYTDLDATVFEVFPDLQFVSVYGIGVDMVDIDAATEHGVIVFHVPDYCVEEVANHTVGLILSCERRLGAYHSDVKSGNWDWELGRPIRRLSTKTLGILGVGRIGRRVAKRMQGFGVDIIGHDPYLSEDELSATGVDAVGFEELCERSDIVTVHTPLNSDTEGLIDDRAIDQMAEDTTLVNAARGEIIEQQALADALAEDRLGYAGLDVLHDEPPEDDQLVGRDDAFVTPHVAWYSEDALGELQRRTAENAARMLRGEDLENVVNPEVLSGDEM